MRTIHEVFTPGQAAREWTFVERAEETNRILVHALRTPGKHVAVFGPSRTGKTTLVFNKLRQLYEREIWTVCDPSMSFTDALIEAFNELAPFYTKTATRGSKAVSGLHADVLGISAELGSESTAGLVEERVLPPKLTAAFLARMLGEAGSCWILDDFHKLQARHRQALADVLRVFRQAANDYPAVKIICIGAVHTASELIPMRDDDLRGLIAEIRVPPMIPRELDEIMQKGEQMLNVVIGDRLRQIISYLANGQPGVCHQLCLNLCFAVDMEQTLPETYTFTDEDFREAVREWLTTSLDRLRADYDRACRASPNAKLHHQRLAVHALARFPHSGATHGDLLAVIREEHPTYRSTRLRDSLKQLESENRGYTLVCDGATGRYAFTAPMLHAYARQLTVNEAVGIDDLQRLALTVLEIVD